MKIFKYILIGLFVLLVIIQFFPAEKPAVAINNPNDIHKEVLISPEVSKMLRNACYDCHSNETVYPWYASIAPISWLVIHDIEEGRKELNFSEWIPYTLRRKNHKLDEIVELVESGEMPMKIYTPLHPEAKLTEEQKAALISWAKNLKGSAE
jgi:hypothetical protein